MKFWCFCLLSLLSTSSWTAVISTPDIAYEVIHNSHHDAKCFTQGLLFHRGFMYESCGMFGESSIRKLKAPNASSSPPAINVHGSVDKSSSFLESDVLAKIPFPAKDFAEGIAVVGNTLFVLTWKNKKAYSIDLDSFTVQGYHTFASHNGQGWGLTYDGERLILSDGSAMLSYFHVPTSLPSPTSDSASNHFDRKLDDWSVDYKVKVQENVKRKTVNVEKLNELEYINGFIYANIWYADRIVKINPSTGRVVGSVSCRSLYTNRPKSADVLNGIAFDPASQLLLITGKYWPVMFWIKFQDMGAGNNNSGNSNSNSNNRKLTTSQSDETIQEELTNGGVGICDPSEAGCAQSP